MNVKIWFAPRRFEVTTMTSARIPEYLPDVPWREVPAEIILFPDGTPHVKIEGRIADLDILIDVRGANPTDFMTAMIAIDACRRAGARSVSLFIPFFPGARQDMPSQGTSLTCKVFADIINEQVLDKVFVVDPHSAVTPALLADCVVLKPWEAFSRLIMSKSDMFSDVKIWDGVICPDAGAEKRVHEAVNSLFGVNRTILHCKKTRNPDTGKLDGFEVPTLAGGRRYLIIDDICDGGGTFIGILEEMKKNLTQREVETHWPYLKFDLMTTHGLYSQGFEKLKIWFDRFYTTDSIPKHPGFWDQTHRVNLMDAFGERMREEIQS